MAYLADIFTYFNELNTSLDKQISIFSRHKKIYATVLKLKFLADCILNANIECFPNLNNILVDSNANFVEDVKKFVPTFIASARNMQIFSCSKENCLGFKPFSRLGHFRTSIKEREQQMDISTDTQLLLKFNQVDITHF